MFVWWTLACTPPPERDARHADVPPDPQLSASADAPAPPPDTEPPEPPPEAGGAPDTGSPVEPRDTGVADTGVADTAGPETADTGGPGSVDTADTAAPPPPALLAQLTVDVDQGEFPLVVTFDGSRSTLSSGRIRYEWSFGDGEVAAGEAVRMHTYRGRGEFEAELVVFDDTAGTRSRASVVIDVDRPDCPSEASPVEWGTLDSSLDAVSGIAASRRTPGLYWVQEDNDDDIAVVDRDGVTLSEHDLPSITDPEDIAVAVDPQTGISMLFVGDIGDNLEERDSIVIFVVEEPDPYLDSDLDPLEMELTFPDGPHDAETMMVDPLTLDLFVVTKEMSDQKVYAKRAPHDGEGPYELEDLGEFEELDLRATAGDISDDGSRIVVRDYTEVARLWFRDAYLPFEAAFEEEPCDIDIVDDSHGEGVTFTLDGLGIVTINEGDDVPLYYVEF